MIEIEKPNINVISLNEDGTHGRFVIEPLERGFGITLGNSLRRIMLSSLPGYAVTSIKIDGVLHEHFELNGKKVNIPSIIVSAGDEIKVRENFRSSAKCKALVEGLDSKIAPKWLSVDKAGLSAKVVALPARDDIDFEFNEQLIVELYSK